MSAVAAYFVDNEHEGGTVTINITKEGFELLQGMVDAEFRNRYDSAVHGGIYQDLTADELQIMKCWDLAKALGIDTTDLDEDLLVAPEIIDLDDAAETSLGCDYEEQD
jgi:hypothetical protein